MRPCARHTFPPSLSLLQSLTVPISQKLGIFGGLLLSLNSPVTFVTDKLSLTVKSSGCDQTLNLGCLSSRSLGCWLALFNWQRSSDDVLSNVVLLRQVEELSNS